MGLSTMFTVCFTLQEKYVEEVTRQMVNALTQRTNRLMAKVFMSTTAEKPRLYQFFF
jgi:hypothetical protein